MVIEYHHFAILSYFTDTVIASSSMKNNIEQCKIREWSCLSISLLTESTTETQGYMVTSYMYHIKARTKWPPFCRWHIEGILPKGPYQPCVSMAGRALLAGYPWYLNSFTSMNFFLSLSLLSLLLLSLLIEFHWHFILRLSLMIRQHWFIYMYMLGTEQAPSHYLNQWWSSVMMN